MNIEELNKAVLKEVWSEDVKMTEKKTTSKSKPEEKKKGGVSKLNMVLLVLTCLLLVLSTAQAVEITKIKDQLSSGDFEVSGSSSLLPTPSRTPSAAAPTMVGGC